MEEFVSQHSIVRRIWGKPDTILFIFAGSAAEFALNKAVDWLYFTGRLPTDPLGRLFSTVTYAREIVFSSLDDANVVIDRMAHIHHAVETKRGSQIPAWAYRDVLYMLIDYSIRSFELLERRITEPEKAEVYDVFRRVGARMGLENLPGTFETWQLDREVHMQQDLQRSDYTVDLFRQYRKHLGYWRYQILRAAQGVIVPHQVCRMLSLNNSALTRFFILVYRSLARLRLDWLIKAIILPPKYFRQVKALESVPPS
jgi:uncharacterized protein (DUF2236 family)